MSKGETAFALGVTAFGVGLMEETLKLPYFVEEVPGPGFLPFWLAAAIIALGLALTLRGVRLKPDPSRPELWPDIDGWGRVGIVVVAAVIGLLLLETAGFLVVAALFVGSVAFGLGVRSWRVLATVPLLAALVLHGVFVVGLKVPLPKGILSFLS